MSEPSDQKQNWKEMREKLIGLGSESIRKSYYPELQRRLRELQSSEARFRAILDQLPFSTQVFLPDGRWVYSNAAYAKLWNISPQAMEYLKEHYRILEDKQLEEKGLTPYIKRAFAGESVEMPPIKYEIEQIEKQLGVNLGLRTRWVRGYMFPIRDSEGNIREVALMHEDVTERKQAEDMLKHQQAFLREVIDASPDLIFVKDEQGRYILANQATADFYATTIDDLLGKTDADLDPEQAERIRCEDTEVLATMQPMVIPAEPLLNLRTRKVHYLRMARLPMIASDGSLQVLGVAADITDIKEAEAHKREFYRRTILAATEGKLEITDRDEICRIAGDPLDSWTIVHGEDISKIRDAVAGAVRAGGMDESRVYDFVLAVGEAITNAYKHAGGGCASLHHIAGGFMFVVADEGPGIEALALPDVALKRGYTTAISLGMGYKAMISVADKVYLATGPGGTTLGIDMKLHPIEIPPILSGLPDTWA